MSYRLIVKLILFLSSMTYAYSFINALSHDDKDYVYECAECMEENEDYREAVKIVQEGFKAKKIIEPFAYSLIADAYLHSGDLNNACLYSNRSLELENSQSAVLSLAEYHASLGDFNASNRYVNFLINNGNLGGHEYARIATIYTRFGMFAQSETFYNKQIDLLTKRMKLGDPDVAPYHILLSYLYLTKNIEKTYVNAMLDLKNYGYDYNSAAEYSCLCVYSLRRLNREKEARKILDDGLAKCNKKSIFYSILKYLDGKIDADALIAEAKKKDTYKEPTNQIRANVWVGLELCRLGKEKEAIPYFQWAVDHQVTVFTSMYVQATAIPLLQKIRNGVPINPVPDKARSAPPRRAAPSNKNQRKAKR